MEYKTVLYSVKDGVADVVMNQPQALNPMNDDSMNDMLAVLAECERDESVKAVVLSGAGKAFCGGGDIRYFKAELEKPGFGLGPLVTKVGQAVLAIRRLSKPVVCAVHGAAAGGGCNLVFACDIAVAADNAKFIEAFVNIGLAPDTGGVFTLPRLIGQARAFELMSTGRPMKADEAYSLGLVNEVCPAEELLDRAHAIAARYAAGPGKVYARLKQMMNASLYSGLEDYLKLEAQYMDELSKTEDFKEGINAFLEKRKAEFKGI